jgi:hypothetical protein
VTQTPGENEADATDEDLRRIEELPLDQRAAAYARINEQLQSALEGGDTPR